MEYPMLNPTASRQVWTEEFSGLDRRPRTGNGSFSAMGNMTGENWPLLCSRKKRGVVAELERPLGLLAAEKLAWIDGPALYYDGKPTPISNLSLEEDMLPKQLISMGAYLLVFPDGVYWNTANPEEYGSVNRLYETAAGQAVRFSLCGQDGAEYEREDMTVGDELPREPQAGAYWLDTREGDRTLYRWNGEWTSVTDVYIRVSAPGIGAGLKLRDGVTLSGVCYTGENETVKKQLEALNETHIIQALGENFIVIPGTLDENVVQTEGAVRADRKAPRMDYIVECNNRLWGCRHGDQDGATVNQIYACALGDFTNWRKYSGTSQDSYLVHVGSDGPFTGAAVHRGNPCFFKENCLHRVYGDYPANFQLQTTQCDGVLLGCAATLTVYNGLMYYLGAHGVQRFESLPECVSQALGQGPWTGGAAGAINGLYYLSVREAGGGWSLYVLDTQRMLWHRQDDARALAFAALNGEMYMLCQNGMLYALNGEAGEPESGEITWYAETPPMGYAYPEKQYMQRFLFRMKLGRGAVCRALVQYDGDGLWLPRGTLQGTGRTGLYLLPIVPRRCESMRVRLEGEGNMELYGMARVLSAGSDGGIGAGT